MKENKYDDPVFFEKYNQMDRSVKGLQGAGEWHILQQLLPDLADKRLLDLGCGLGWHCRYAAAHGAREVIGVDLSVQMLETARAKTKSGQIVYVEAALEDFAYGTACFDVVLSSLALHYVQDFGQICQKVYDCLVPGGYFVFSAEHPIFTAKGDQQWFCNGQGDKLHWPVDDYFREGQRQAVFLGEPVIKYHKTLTTYLDSLLMTGFQLKRIVEPQPEKELLEIPEMLDELRRPMMLLIQAVKP